MSGDAHLTEQYGSPLYVYDLQRAVAARDDLYAALPEGTVLYYSFKANPHPEIARALREGDGPVCKAEISSTGELAAAITAGFDPAEILYTGPGKTGEEVAAALDAGVRTFSAESLGDLRRIGRAADERGVTADCLLRVNSAGTGATTSIRMTGTPSQFGFDSETLPAVMPELRAVPGVRLAGMHLFSLSNARDEDSLIAEFEHTIAAAAEVRDAVGLEPELLDLGGGFASPYLTPGERPVYPNLRAALEKTLDGRFPGWRDGAPRIACESGRYLAGDCGRLVCTVTNIKESRGRRFVILDAGINTLGGMSGLGRLLPVSVGLAPDPVPADGRAEDGVASLVGPLCTPGDTFGHNVSVPDLRPGDVVTIPNAGAYGLTASLLMFLGRPAPTEVITRGDQVVSASRIGFDRIPR
ncbi:type III PLP-dependent enzyme [Marinactinospora thermotolerans]|uniref:Diaminopimelate decarboxylase n=1 Tax=Marinactinospora thermotolerans DSM 45154 TaxID=1122192 RepID=A0A1T4THM3_9ACTN|nr:decarboxylase [Marinactinospora thermotolerans]SKA39985.1 diaminopimelate decarboxylase [Marinactinospora thermotolerans DSM 45154]